MRDQLREHQRERPRCTAGTALAEIEQQLGPRCEVIRGERQPVIDRRRQLEPVRGRIAERAVELVESPCELGDLDVRRCEILPQHLQAPPWIRSRARRRRDMALDVVDDHPEPIAQRAQRIGELARDLGGDVARELLPHRLPVSSSQVWLIPSDVSPCE